MLVHARVRAPWRRRGTRRRRAGRRAGCTRLVTSAVVKRGFQPETVKRTVKRSQCVRKSGQTRAGRRAWTPGGAPPVVKVVNSLKPTQAKWSNAVKWKHARKHKHTWAQARNDCGRDIQGIETWIGQDDGGEGDGEARSPALAMPSTWEHARNNCVSRSGPPAFTPYGIKASLPVWTQSWAPPPPQFHHS